MKKLMLKLEEILDQISTKQNIACLAVSGAALLLSLLDRRFDLFALNFNIAWVAIILCGVPIILEAVIGLVTRFDIRADVLVSIALIASICIHEVFAAGEIAVIMQLGALMEDLTVARAKSGIEKLVRLTPQIARIVTESGQSFVHLEEVRAGDVLRVLPGETVPVDGVILSGETSINQAILTGESLPVDKKAGDEVFSGTVNQFGAFHMKATKVGEDSSIQRLIRLVQSADAGKAKIVSLADRWATWIVVIALSAAMVTWWLSGEIIRAVTILVVFCPCALVLATPTAIIAAIGNATKHGFLVREGDALERLAVVDRITFDKTGTLTYGTPEVITVRSVSDHTEQDIYSYTAAAEKLSEHPLGKAIVKCYGKELPDPDSFHMEPGAGVTASVHGKTVLAGSRKLLIDNGAAFPESDEADRHIRQGSTVIYIALDSVPAGYIVLADTLREESAEMIRKLGSFGVTPVLLTGDHESSAAFISGKLGIREYKAGCLPEDKLAAIGKMQAGGCRVCMIGDGINDAPALKKSDVGIAMGGVGSDIAIDAADIALVDDEIKELPHLLALSRRMMTTIKVNLTFSLSLNFLAIILAITGLLGPVIGALVHNAGSILVIINSALLLKWNRKT